MAAKRPGLTQALGRMGFLISGVARIVADHVLRLFSALARGCARMVSRQLGTVASLLQTAFPAASSPGARFWSALGPWRWGALVYPLLSRRATVRPNSSFKPTPLRGAA